VYPIICSINGIGRHVNTEEKNSPKEKGVSFAAGELDSSTSSLLGCMSIILHYSFFAQDAKLIAYLCRKARGAAPRARVEEGAQESILGGPQEGSGHTGQLAGTCRCGYCETSSREVQRGEEGPSHSSFLPFGVRSMCGSM
jgi:hypothetical protein